MKINLRTESKSVVKSFTVEPNKETFQSRLESEMMRNPKARNFVQTSLMSLSGLGLFIQPANIDPDLLHTITILEVTEVIVGVSVACLALGAAGIWRMVFGGRAANEWSESILKGLAQVVAAPVLVSLVIGLSILLFSNLPAFQPFVPALTGWFKN